VKEKSQDDWWGVTRQGKTLNWASRKGSLGKCLLKVSLKGCVETSMRRAFQKEVTTKILRWKRAGIVKEKRGQYS
jgi:hypothetical protein